jgi:hypothetical protein
MIQNRQHGRDAAPDRRLDRARVACVAVLAVLALGVSCRGGGDGTRLDNVDATVEHFPVDSDNLVLVPDANPEERYLPDDLPLPFRLAGLKVRFSARIVAPPPNARLFGTPIRLLRIARREGVNPS